MRTLIKTAGRTGSHVIAQLEMERLGVDYLYHNHEQPLERLYALPGPVVVHDHTKMIPSDADKWDLIVSLRRSVYDQAVSYCIAKQSQNFGHAPAPDGDFIIDDELFLITFKNFKVVNYYWKLLAALYNWHSVREIYWEDLLPLDRAYTLNHPAADKSRVVNHDQLQELSQRYADNHNWAVDQAVELAEKHIGVLGRVAARALVVDL